MREESLLQDRGFRSLRFSGGIAEMMSSLPKEKELVVAVSRIFPCAFFTEDGEVRGFSAELWQEVAREGGWKYRFEHVPFAKKLEMVRSGAADAAIGCISTTSEREAFLDFAGSTMNSGLVTLSLKADALLDIITPRIWKSSIRFLIFSLASAFVLWLLERRNPKSPIKKFGDASTLISCSFILRGHPQLFPVTTPGNLFLNAVSAAGVAFFLTICIFQIGPSLVNEKPRVDIESSFELVEHRVATKIGTVSHDFLLEVGVAPVLVSNIEEAYELLQKKKVDLVIFDKPVIHQYARKNTDVMIVGPTFMPHDYAFAFPQGSPLKEKVNQVLLQLKENGEFGRIYRKWFSKI